MSELRKTTTKSTFCPRAFIFQDFSGVSITSLGFKHDSYDLHHHIIIATPHNSYNISRKKVSMEI